MPAAIKELALCHVIKGGTLLLMKTDKGMSKGKWNAPNGEVVQGEAPFKSAMKHVFQQTGLYVNKVTYHGTIRLFLNGKNEFSYKLHIFSTKFFTGELKPNIEGEAKWFETKDIPYYEMWADDKYWINLVMQGKKFDADFFFDEKNEKVLKYQIREKKEVVQKYLPGLIVVAIIAVVISAVLGSGVLNFRHSAAPPSNTGKNNTAFAPSKSTTSVQTTILGSSSTTERSTSTSTSTSSTSTTTIPVPTVISIDNIDLTTNYSGPSMKGDIQCNVPSKASVASYHRVVTNSTFIINVTFDDQGCNETITRIYTTTPGFRVVQVLPTVPVILPAYSNMYFDIKLVSINKTYSGPLSIIENYQ